MDLTHPNLDVLERALVICILLPCGAVGLRRITSRDNRVENIHQQSPTNTDSLSWFAFHPPPNPVPATVGTDYQTEADRQEFEADSVGDEGSASRQAGSARRA